MSATAEPIPRISQYKQLKDIRTLDEAVDHPEVVRRFQNALGTNFDAPQYLATIRNLIRENDLFRQADLWELIRCALDLAELGLRPNTPFGHAWIIPRLKNKGKKDEHVTLDPQIGYQGYLELAYRADALASIHADVVYEGDVFEFEYGSNAHLKHVPKGSRRTRPAVHVYCYAKLRNGGEQFLAWPYEDVLQIRDESEAFKFARSVKDDPKMGYVWDKCVWVKWEHSMLCKTMLKQVLKVLPKSSERLSHAAYIDNLAEAGRISYGGVAGDLNAGPRELTHQPGATLHDFGFKAPVMDGKAEAPAAGQSMGQQQRTSESKVQPAKTATSAQAGGWQAGPPNDGRFPDEPGARTNLRLISADGEILLDNAMNLTDWAKEFVDHLKIVPADMLQAYEEHNADVIQDVLADAEVRDILLNAGVTGQPAPARTAAPIDEDALIVRNPGGRITDAQIIELWSNSLDQVDSPEMMTAWRKVNLDTVNSFHGKVKLPIYRAMGACCRALGIELT